MKKTIFLVIALAMGIAQFSAAQNLISNPCVDLNTTGWYFQKKIATPQPVVTFQNTTQTGYSGKALKINITTAASGLDAVQLQAPTFAAVSGKTYQIKYRISGNATGSHNLRLLNPSFTSRLNKWGYGITTTPTVNKYTYACTNSENITLAFEIGTNLTSIYLDDVEVTEVIPTSPEIDLTEGSLEILDNNVSNTGGSNYSFGAVSVGTPVTKTFTIKNNGTATLNLTGSPIIAVTGTGFSVTQPAVNSLAAAASTTFTVTYTAADANASTGTISIANDDVNENPFNFPMDANAPVVAYTPSISVKQGTNVITNTTGTYDFGNVVTATPTVITFTVQNSGTDILNLMSTPAVVALTGTGFTLSKDASSLITPAATTTFNITFNPATVGSASGSVSIVNDDATKTPFTFALTGNGINPSTAITNTKNTNVNVNAVNGGVMVQSASKQPYKVMNTLGQQMAEGICNGDNQFIPISKKGIYIVQINKSAMKVLIND